MEQMSVFDRKVLVFGAGFLGHQIAKVFNGNLSFVRIEDPHAVWETLRKYKPDVVINAAGKPSGSCNIDWCLDHMNETVVSNIIGPYNLASACKSEGVGSFVLLSSGCIFDERPDGRSFKENDEPNPVNFYGVTKVAAERIVRRLFEGQEQRLLIPRIRMPISYHDHPRNLISKLVRYSRGAHPVVNAPNSVTVVDDFLFALVDLVERNRHGIFHVVNPKPVTHAQILGWCREFGLLGQDVRVKLVTPEEFKGLKVTKDGRSNCVLDDTKLRMIEGIKLRDTWVAIRDCLKNYARTH